MKNSKKTWGILGTSMGSMLIIVALLTMVGMGSSDTYAAGECVCGTGQTKRGSDCFDSTTQAWVGTCTSKSSSSSASCPIGNYTNSSGQCVTCPAGYYCSNPGQKEPYICPKNYYCPAGTIVAEKCPDGTKSELGSSTCIPTSGSTTTCPAGKYKMGGECVTCELGYYCPGDGSKNACPAGTTSSAGASSSSDCKSAPTTCPAGKYKIGGECVTCELGYYCPGDGSKNACPAGTT